MSDVTIRKAVRSDMDSLLKMAEDFIKVAPYTVPYDKDTCEAEFVSLMEYNEAVKTIIVAEYEGKLAGMVAGLRVPFFYNKNYHQSSEWFWWVDEEYRDKGIGDMLRLAYENWAKGHGVHQICVCTMRNNMSLLEKYKKDGYVASEFFHVKVV